MSDICRSCGKGTEGTLFLSMDGEMEYCSICMQYSPHLGKCYDCGKPMKDSKDGWHSDIKWIKYSNYSDELVTCWENHQINERVDADCS